MSVRRTTLLALVAALALPAAADKLDKESKKWLEEVSPIVLPEEKQTYTDLKDRGERAEFEKIFWARRDPNLETPENEYKTATFDPRKADADKRYKVAGRLGSQTDCGRLFVLFGEPDEVKKEPSDVVTFRPPETWTFRDRPPITFPGGQTKVSLDGECKLANPNASRELDRVAGSLILNPNLTYKVAGGKLTKLADLLPKPSPAQTLLKAPRQDFPVAAQQVFLKVEGGSTGVLGLVHADAAQLTLEDIAGKKVARVTVCAQAVDESGRAVAFDEHAVVAPVADDGSVVAGFKMVVKPGKYQIKAGLIEEKTGKGSIASETREAPDLNKGELTAASLLILADIVDTTSVEPSDPYAAFFLGRIKLLPRFPLVFSATDQAQFFYQAYDPSVDPATGKANVSAKLTLSKGLKVVATNDQTFDNSPLLGSAIGPVTFDHYEPGAYVARLKLVDNVAKKELVVETPFEIKK